MWSAREEKFTATPVFYVIESTLRIKAQPTAIEISGSQITNARARVLSASDIHARNTFDQPNAVKPIADTVADSSPLAYSFKPASVTSLDLELG